jgi:adenine-specific DNA-methyltransferase
MGSNDLKKIGLYNLFDTPKPVELIKYLIRISIGQKNNARILDFFAGSGTTAQAVYEINAEDNKNLSYILVQMPEKLNAKTNAYKTAIELGIKPSVDQAMLLRINTFLKLQKGEIDYAVSGAKVEELD